MITKGGSPRSKYLSAVRRLMARMERTQKRNIDRAATFVIRALTRPGKVCCYGLGHGMEGDFINRAGGLAAVQHFVVPPAAKPASGRAKKKPARPDSDLLNIRKAVRSSKLRRGDVVLVGSVSGRNRVPVELALSCRKRGIRVIAFTALPYTRKVTSLHPSGKRLCDAADVVVDLGVPYGDAGINIPGVDHHVLPLSGVATLLSGWMLWERVVDRMAHAGNPPTTFISLNRKGGKEYYDQAQAQYKERGY